MSIAAAEIFNKLADLYQEKFMNVSIYGNSFEFFCDAIEKRNADILELACGPGNITKYLMEKRADFNILGTDLSLNMVNLARSNNPTVTFKVMDSRALDTLEQSFNGIMCGFLLPYLSKKETFTLIHDVAELLCPDGIFYLSTMEDDYEKSGLKKGSTGDELFMYYHQANYLIEVLTENQLEPIKLERIETKNPDGTMTTDLILISRKK